MSTTKSKPIITLLTDFGTRDNYVGVMKGVILQIVPEARIVYISHQVPKFDIRHAAFLLSRSTSYFPAKSIHVAVVDPGVGSQRAPLIVETNRSILVGPDNGVLSTAASREGIKRVVRVENERYVLPTRSGTFDGRDVFAPVSAHLARGIPVGEFGRPADRIAELSISKPEAIDGHLDCEVLHIDDFGNTITNVDSTLFGKTGIGLGDKLRLETGDRRIEMRFCRTYSDAEGNEPIALIGSHDLLEIAMNRGSAAKLLGARIGQKLRIAARDSG